MTECEWLEKQLDQAARRFAESHDEKDEREIEHLSLQLAAIRYLVVLDDALARCHDEDMRTTAVFEALEHLSKRVATGWPIYRFRAALEIKNEEGRWQNIHAALNAIRRAMGL